jgi:hypothetical protein
MTAAQGLVTNVSVKPACLALRARPLAVTPAARATPGVGTHLAARVRRRLADDVPGDVLHRYRLRFEPGAGSSGCQAFNSP